MMQRVAEPELMDSPDQVAAYAAADFGESNAAFVDRLLASLDEPILRPAARVDSDGSDTNGQDGHEDRDNDRDNNRRNDRRNHRRLIDLGCGPGDICRRLARGLPGWTIEGLDAGANMLAEARRATAAEPEADRISYRLARLPEPSLPRNAYSIVVSNSLLHHLPEPRTLWEAVRDLAAPAARVQIMDLARPASPAQARSLVETHASGEPDVLREDFFNSLRAAWTVDEVAAQLEQAGLALSVDMVSDRHWLVHGRMPG